ncbi:MAG: YbaB/EbfC family nucleoid-associated protein [Treponema sp.]|nr:YbaB/EbfC family nucleoid-associated protein [Treponema sp.]
MDINPFELLKNAHKIKEQMGTFQEKLSSISVTGSSGGGLVEIELNGTFEMTAVRIAPEILAAGDAQMLQDLLIAAHSNGFEKIKEEINREMGAIAGGLPGFPV